MPDGLGASAAASGVTREYDGWCGLVTATKLSSWPTSMAICNLTLQGLELEHVAMLDTGAQYSVMPYQLALELGISEADGERAKYHTRDGPLWGVLVRHSARLRAEEGEGIDVIDAEWFVSGDWSNPPPVIVGWQGFLEAIAFGCDPGTAPDDQGKFFFAML